MPEHMICVAAIAGAFGVHGDVRLKSFTADPSALEAYAPLVTQDNAQSFTVHLTGRTKNALTGRLSGITSKEQADALKGVKLFVPRDRLPSLPDDEFYHADLEGLHVFDSGGQDWGRVITVQNHGASDLLEIQGPNLKASILLPFTRAAVPTVDLAEGKIIIDPPDGLLPDLS